MSEMKQGVSTGTKTRRKRPGRQDVQEGRQRKISRSPAWALALVSVILLLGIATSALVLDGKSSTGVATPAPIATLAGKYRLAFERDGEIYVAGGNGQNPAGYRGGGATGGGLSWRSLVCSAGGSLRQHAAYGNDRGRSGNSA